MPDRGEIHIPDQHQGGPPGRPSFGVLAVVGAVVIAAVIATFLARTINAPQAVDVTDPEVPETTVPTSLPDAPTGGDALSTLVPDLEGTIVMTVEIAGTVERWEWRADDSGPARLPLSGHLTETRLDASGGLAAAIERYAHEPLKLLIGEGPDLGVIFYAVHSYVWHETEPGSLAWLSQDDPDRPAVIHTGYTRGRMVYSKPLARLEGVDLVTPGRRDGIRLAAFDDHGVVVEEWLFDDDKFTARVTRITVDGEIAGEAEGVLAGVAPGGVIVVASTLDAAALPVLYGPDMAPVGELQGPAGHVLWSPDGSKRAAVYPGPVVEVRDGESTTSLAVPLDNPRLEAWSPDGRFVVLTGVRDEIPTLAFVNTWRSTVSIVRLSAYPISVRFAG
jgi:hypothetical protein